MDTLGAPNTLVLVNGKVALERLTNTSPHNIHLVKSDISHSWLRLTLVFQEVGVVLPFKIHSGVVRVKRSVAVS